MTQRPRFNLDRARRKLSGKAGPRFWMGVDELVDQNAFRQMLVAEFPSAATLLDDPQRRQLLKLMGASLLLAGLGACSPSNSGEALPYVNQPETMLPGVPRYFATALTFAGYAQPVIATAYDGRPTKLDGNPDHPATLGRSDAFMQAAIFGLYNPGRAQQPLKDGAPSSWASFQNALIDLRRTWQDTRGAGLRFVIGPTTSPTVARQMAALLKEFPEARLHLCDPLNTQRDAAMRLAFGRSVEQHVAFEECDIIVSLDDDFLGPGPHQVRNAIGFAQRRGDAVPGKGRNRLHVAESIPGAAGAQAASRIAASPSRIRELARALNGEDAQLSAQEKAWAKRATDDLRAHAGRGAVLAGAHLELDVQAFAAQLNDRFGNAGKTVRYTDPIRTVFDGAADLATLARDMAAGHVDSLVCIDCNPAYLASPALALFSLIPQVKNRIAFGMARDETAALCQWHLPLSHALESWSDARAVDGTVSLIQPLIHPLYATRTLPQGLDMLAGLVEPAPEVAVRTTWRERLADEGAWRQALRKGLIDNTAAPFIGVSAGNVALTPASEAAAGQTDIVIQPDPTVWDGCFSTVSALQELAKPVTKTTWSNVVTVGPALAHRLGVNNGDKVAIESDGRRIEGAAWILPGQGAYTIGLTLGYGRTQDDDAYRRGYNAASLLPASGALVTTGRIGRVSGSDTIATTQQHHRIDGFDLVREVTAAKPETEKPKAATSLYPDWNDDGVAWGMVIDLDLCIGCNGCVAACNVENNVAVAGEDQVARGRAMAWLRVDRYYSGDIEAPRTHFQPVPCMHCEKAPCEMGCPVQATVHSPDGINQQIYNRCIGTRTCSSYCPYKVRRFNWYDFRDFSDQATAAKNPDVTVRSRGVMEKCTYCTQRVQAARVAADKEGRSLRDGDVVTACQQACPTKAITFGNIRDGLSAVAQRRKSERHYALLEELGTRPRTTYLARWNDSEGDDT